MNALCHGMRDNCCVHGKFAAKLTGKPFGLSVEMDSAQVSCTATDRARATPPTARPDRYSARLSVSRTSSPTASDSIRKPSWP
jgi:hypothetical protein